MANEGFPNEICGFIMRQRTGGSWYFQPCKNIHKNPEHYFEIDPEDLVKIYDKEECIIGMYHSHPNGPEGPSSADRKYAPDNGIRYFIVTRTHVHEYDMTRDQVRDG